LALLVGVLTLLAGAASATPLGLQNGDTVDTLEFDALAVNGDGVTYTWDGVDGEMLGDGQLTSVTVTGPSAPLIGLGGLNVVFTFAVDLLNYDASALPSVNTFFTGAAGVHPDVTVTQGISANVILTGNFATNFIITGSVLNPSMLAVGDIVITGGHADLVDALGGAGGTAFLNLVATATSFSPSLTTGPLNLGGDGNIVNSNFFVELSGTLTPTTASAFVPEPTTALVLGTGLLGLLAFGRRRSR
jgi:hypothetical protein